MFVYFLFLLLTENNLPLYNTDYALPLLYSHSGWSVYTCLREEYLSILGMFCIFNILSGSNAPIATTLLFHWYLNLFMWKPQLEVLRIRGGEIVFSLLQKDIFYLVPLYCLTRHCYSLLCLHVVLFYLKKHRSEVIAFCKSHPSLDTFREFIRAVPRAMQKYHLSSDLFKKTKES